jgi:hypothetical protein
MSSKSSPETPSVQHLRERCLAEGVRPDPADLEGVAAFLDTILPALGRIEASLDNGDAVAGLFLPAPEAR